MKTILRLTSQRAQVALAAALLLGCSLNVIVAAHVARSGTAAAATPARWGQLPGASSRIATAPRAAGEGGAIRPDAVRGAPGRAS